jgi:hypothetical protein
LCHARILGALARVSARAFHVRVCGHSRDVPLSALALVMLLERFCPIVGVCDCFALVRVS